MKRFRIIALALGLLACGGWFSGKLLVRSWTQKPPPLPADTSILQASITTRGDKTWLGQSWLAEREGLTVIRLKGSPFAMGYASGRLLEKKMHTLEDEFLVMIHGYVPQSWKLHVLKTYVTFRNRHLSRFVPLDYRLQIFGTTRGCPDAHPELGDYYDRLLNYHAAHDISYMMIDNPLVSKAGCTAFGAWGNATADGHLITGRNFDWEAAEVFSRDRIVMLYEPDDGIPFVSLAWASMAGVVSGMNRAGVSITINGAPSSLPGETATPIALVAREVLQRARNLTNALEIIRTNRVFVSALLLVGSRADGKFVVVEKTPETTNVREAQGDTIVSANHFETGKLKDDERNLRYLAEGTSLTRYRRLNELLQAQHGHLTPERAAALLRDRHLPGGKFPGNGHRGTLNALIATHATIMDLAGGIFWAASPPHQLGKFVAFDVNDFERELPARTIPDDPMLGDGELEKFQTAQRALQEGQRALKNQQATEALAAAERAERNNPGFYQNAELRGRAWLRLGRTEEARQALETALAASPAFRSETEQLEKLLQSTRDAK